ncbi:MAG: amidohydrolase [Chloroflexi bacterium]|nr:amidohydrolase [Chloroflexota bacterium]
MILDMHAHVIPPEALREVNPAEEWRPRVFRDEQGKQKVDHGGVVIGAATREFVHIDRILAEQRPAGVDVIALSPWTSLFNYERSTDDALRSGRLQNEAIARYVRDYPQQVAGYGTVPLQYPALAAREAAHVVKQLGLNGIEIGTNVNGVYLGDEKLLPFWEAVAALDTFVFVHPVPGVGGPLMRQYDLGNLYGNPAENGLTTASLIFGGVLERFPSLKICIAHGGGVLPYIIGRLDQGYRARARSKTIITRLPSEYLRMLYFDTITHSAEALRYLIAVVGADHVLLGSDYPFDMGYERPAELVNSLNLPPAEAQAILGASAARLLKFSAA